MNKKVAFAILSLLAVTFAILGRRLQPTFLEDVWSQLFWLTVTILFTSFVVEAIIRHAAHLRQRSVDRFAFRSFSANLIKALETIVGIKVDDKLFEAALSGDQKFDEAAKDAASRIQKSVDFDPGAYLKHYLDISGSLRTLANNYIRLFSSNEKDMLTQYRELVALANEWTYVDEFSERSREYTKSLAADDSDKSKRVAEYDAQSSSARSVVVNTSKQVAELAAKTAHGKGFYV